MGRYGGIEVYGSVTRKYAYAGDYSYGAYALGSGVSESSETWEITRIHRTTLATATATGAWSNRESLVYT